MKKKHIKYLILIIIPIGLLFGFFTYRNSLLGGSLSLELRDHNFDDLNMRLKAPSDWLLFDASGNDALDNQFDQHLIITGAKSVGSYPRIFIYSFDHTIVGIDDILEFDILRVQENYGEELYRIPSQYGLDGEHLMFSFYEDDFSILKLNVEIECREWIGHQNDTILLVSLCASKPQWDKLDVIYFHILNSIEID
jgi:hypothetical protein